MRPIRKIEPMATREKIDQIIRLVSARYRIDFQPEDLAGWKSVLEAMTDAQVAVAERHFNHEYRGEWPPQPADFKAWGATAPQQWNTEKKVDRNYIVERIDKSEYRKRLSDLAGLMNGTIGQDLWMVYREWGDGPERRAWLREKLGWSQSE